MTNSQNLIPTTNRESIQLSSSETDTDQEERTGILRIDTSGTASSESPSFMQQTGPYIPQAPSPIEQLPKSPTTIRMEREPRQTRAMTRENEVQTRSMRQAHARPRYATNCATGNCELQCNNATKQFKLKRQSSYEEELNTALEISKYRERKLPYDRALEDALRQSRNQQNKDCQYR